MYQFRLCLILVIGLVGGLLTFSSVHAQSSKLAKGALIAPVKVTYVTKDGYQIVADYYKPRTAGKYGVVIAMHQLDSTRSSWRQFAEAWATHNMAVLCPDLRGHGESTKTTDGKTHKWQEYSKIEFLAMDNDFEAAVKYLYDSDPRCKVQSRLVVGGASIGANLALRYAATTKVRGVFLLSPGAEYRGVGTQIAAEKLGKCQLLVCVSDDDEQSVPGSKMIYQTPVEPLPKRLKSYKGSAHGTDLLAGNNGLQGLLFAWLLNLV